MEIVNTPYDDVFRTLLNDCTSLIIPVINEAFKEKYKCTIIEMSNKVLEHIARKYEKVKEGVKTVMGGRIGREDGDIYGINL